MSGEPEAVGSACRVVLVGMMGSGKSTIGELLSTATGWPYIDNDTLVQRATGLNARELLAAEGEEPMRRAEAAALKLALEQREPCIVGVAAGVVLEADARAALEPAHVVWLHASPRSLAARAIGGDHRPWLDTDPETWMAATLEARRALYAQVADLVVDTDALSPAETAAEILAWLRPGPCQKWLRGDTH